MSDIVTVLLAILTVQVLTLAWYIYQGTCLMPNRKDFYEYELEAVRCSRQAAHGTAEFYRIKMLEAVNDLKVWKSEMGIKL